MDNLEKVEKLVSKTNVSYEEAKNALETCEWDILDALVYLEKLGKVNGPKAQTYTTEYEVSNELSTANYEYEQSCKRTTIGEALNDFFVWCGDLIKKGCENIFEIKRYNEVICSMPVIVLVIIMICAFWVVIPFMVVGLFLNFRYSFRGSLKYNEEMNNISDKMADKCQNIKEDFQNSSNKNR